MRVSYTQKLPLPNCASLEKDNEGEERVREDRGEEGRERKKGSKRKKGVLSFLLCYKHQDDLSHC